MNLRRLGRPTGHRKALFRNLVTDLIRHEKITTTETKAKRDSVFGREDDYPREKRRP